MRKYLNHNALINPLWVASLITVLIIWFAVNPMEKFYADDASQQYDSHENESISKAYHQKNAIAGILQCEENCRLLLPLLKPTVNPSLIASLAESSYKNTFEWEFQSQINFKILKQSLSFNKMLGIYRQLRI